MGEVGMGGVWGQNIRGAKEKKEQVGPVGGGLEGLGFVRKTSHANPNAA